MAATVYADLIHEPETVRLELVPARHRGARTLSARRRRMLAALAAVLLVLALAFQLAVSGSPAPTAGAGSGGGGSSLTGAAEYVVQPGDTLWSIAAALSPGGDIRATVDHLADLNGGAGLDVGQRLRLR